MKWSEVAARIAAMTPEQQDKPALVLDENEGRFCEVSQIHEPQDDETDSLYIVEEQHWYESENNDASA